MFPAAILFETHPLLKENTCTRKKKPNKIPQQMISRLLVSFSRQLEVLMTTQQSTNSLVIPGSQYSNFQY